MKRCSISERRIDIDPIRRQKHSGGVLLPRVPQRTSLGGLRALRPPVLSCLTDVEFHSALAKKVRRGELAEGDAEWIQDLFRTHVSRALYEVAAIEQGDFVQARQWMARMDTALRTLDALHLVVAHRRDLGVLTADRGLADAGRAFEIEVELMRADDSS